MYLILLLFDDAFDGSCFDHVTQFRLGEVFGLLFHSHQVGYKGGGRRKQFDERIKHFAEKIDEGSHPHCHFFGIAQRDGFGYQFADNNRNIGNQKHNNHHGNTFGIRFKAWNGCKQWRYLAGNAHTSVSTGDKTD